MGRSYPPGLEWGSARKCAECKMMEEEKKRSPGRERGKRWRDEVSELSRRCE
jgi:hypothetical protein